MWLILSNWHSPLLCIRIGSLFRRWLYIGKNNYLTSQYFMCKVSDVGRCCFSVRLNTTFLIEPSKVLYLSIYLGSGYWLIGVIKMGAYSRLCLSVLLGLYYYTTYFRLAQWNLFSFLFRSKTTLTRLNSIECVGPSVSKKTSQRVPCSLWKKIHLKCGLFSTFYLRTSIH